MIRYEWGNGTSMETAIKEIMKNKVLRQNISCSFDALKSSEKVIENFSRICAESIATILIDSPCRMNTK